MQPNKKLAIWLLVNCAMIFIMVVIGAITRLTESGLSIADWKPVQDMMPPIGTAAWQEAFAKYQLTPEYIQKNSGMDMDSFQTIYFWEWLHRLWGRLIGLVYVLPLIWFWIRKQVPGELKPRLVFFLFLGGLQGAIGWYMVKSGLIDEPRVSHYRLALHLAAAFVLFALLWAQALQLLPKFRHALLSYQPYVKFCIKRHAWVALFLVSATILWGAFVAGLDAGLIYNTFPMMNGKWVPDEFLFEKPWWKNFLDNHATVQWMHRMLGMASFVAVFSLGLRAIATKNPMLKKIGHCLSGMIALQVVLGIVTLLTQVALHPAVTHQAGALLTVAFLTMFLVTAHSKQTV